MKKVFALALAASMMAGASQAQEAFKHLGMSVEVGTTGLGVNLSYPLVKDHLIVTLGYNLPTYTINTDFDLNGSIINNRIASANAAIDSYNSIIEKNPEVAADKSMSKIDRIENVSTINTEIEAKINFVNFKALLEFYPTTKSAFHFTAGVYVGDGEWMSINAQADPAVWSVYKRAVDQNKLIPTLSKDELAPGVPGTDIRPVEGLDKAAVFNLNGETYCLDPNSGGRLDTKLTIQKVKPYLGVGFGSSVPTRKRLGCQLEIGAYYQGKPTLESPSKLEAYNAEAFSSKTVDDIIKTVVHFEWYPQLTLRFTGRLF